MQAGIVQQQWKQKDLTINRPFEHRRITMSYNKYETIIELMPKELGEKILNEGNFHQWSNKKTKYKCYVIRPFVFGQWNGYVELPKDHPYYGKYYDDMDNNIDVHGGITYSDYNGWVGFDCAHGWDLKPDLEYGYYYYPSRDTTNEHYWTKEEVIEETNSLAEQLYHVVAQ